MDTQTIRHDFNNQLGIIRGLAEVMLAEAAPDAPSRADLDAIYKAAVTALSLLARLYPDPPGSV